MKKMNSWLLASLFMGAMAFSACSSSDDTPSGGTTPSVQPGTPVNPANMKMSALSGFVKDAYGYALKDVEVISGTETTKTDANGGFVLNSVNAQNGRTVVKFQKDGYMEIVRAAEKVDGDVWEVVMVSTWDTDIALNQAYSTSSTGLSKNGMSVNLQADGYKVDATGSAFSGLVNQQMLYLSPDKENFGEMMPGGDLAAVRSGENGGTAGEQVQLISYGMTKVDLTDVASGQKLQLADGKPATLTFPVPEKFKDNTPAEIPLWSFNETTGLWEEEGIATYDAGQNVYVGTVTHFSWVNLDYPERRVTLKVIVKDANGNVVPNVKVDIDGQKNITTNNKGEAETYVPRATDFYVTIHSEDYANYPNEVKVEVEPLYEDKTVTIELPTLAHISGKIINKGEGGNIATVWIEYNGKSTKKVHSDVNGQFYLNAPADYEGVAVLKVRTGDGKTKSINLELNGKDQAFEITVNSAVGNGGAVQLKYQDKTWDLTIDPIDDDELYGATILDDEFYIEPNEHRQGQEIDWEKGIIMFYTRIEKFKDGVARYDSIDFGVNRHGGEYVSANGSGAGTVTKSGDTYRIQAEVNALIYADGIESSGKNETNGTMKVDVSIPLLYKAVTKKNVKAADVPSFVTLLSGRSNIAAVITESAKLGKGCSIVYGDSTLTSKDFNTLKEAAKKQFGEPMYDSNAGGREVSDDNYQEVKFFKDGKYLFIAYNPWDKWADEDLDNVYFNFNYPNGRIGIIALPAVTVPISALDYYVKAERKDWQPVWSKRK